MLRFPPHLLQNDMCTRLKGNWNRDLGVFNMSENLSWDHPKSYPVKFEDSGQNIRHVQGMSSKCPRWKNNRSYYILMHRPASWRSERLKNLLKSKKIQDSFNDGWCTGGYICEGSIKSVIKCQDRKREKRFVWFEDVLPCPKHVQDIPN